jgi:hypothetical protein
MAPQNDRTVPQGRAHESLRKDDEAVGRDRYERLASGKLRANLL